MGKNYKLGFESAFTHLNAKDIDFESNIEESDVHPKCQCCKVVFCNEECEKQIEEELTINKLLSAYKNTEVLDYNVIIIEGNIEIKCKNPMTVYVIEEIMKEHISIINKNIHGTVSITYEHFIKN